MRQEWALSSKETVATVSPALLVKFVILADISASPPKAEPVVGLFFSFALRVFLRVLSQPCRGILAAVVHSNGGLRTAIVRMLVFHRSTSAMPALGGSPERCAFYTRLLLKNDLLSSP
jgi:hypothetical protein